MAYYNHWYVFTGGDEYSNEVVSRKLEGCDISKGILCKDRVSRDMWFCKDYETVRELDTARINDRRLSIEIFTKRGQNGVVRSWELNVKSYRSRQARKYRLQESLER
jgi:hypothetical protein